LVICGYLDNNSVTQVDVKWADIPGLALIGVDSRCPRPTVIGDDDIVILDACQVP
jgi:hypothetical protein